MGRKRLQVDLDEIREWARIGCSGREMAAMLGCDESTLRKRPDISAVIEQGDACGKIQIRRKQHHRAVEDGSDSMLQFLGKHRLDQRDKPESSDVNALFDDAISEPEIPPTA